MNELQPLWRPESARAAPERCDREAARGGGSPCPSHPPFSLSLPPAGLRARLGPVPLSPPRTPPPPPSPTPHLGRPALPWVRVGARAARRTSPVHPPGGAEPERRSPLVGSGHGERGVSPHPGRTQELRRRARGGGGERWIGRTRGRKGGWGSEGKVKLGGESGGRWGLMLLFFVAAVALALVAEPEGRRWRDDCRVGEQRSGARFVSQHPECGFLLR